MFPYYGSKWSIARRYQEPAYGLVIEPFAGSAGYSTYYGVRKALLVDMDPIVAGLWSYLIKATPAEIMALPEMPEAGDSVDNYDLPQEAKWLIGFWLNRGSAQPKKTRTEYSTRCDRGQLNWGARAKERIAGQLHLIAEWEVRQADFRECPDVEATWFVDPPYMDKGRFYRTGFDDFEALGRWTRERRGLVIACEGPDADWLPFKEMGSFKSTTGKAREFVYVAVSDKPPIGGLEDPSQGAGDGAAST